MHAITKTHRYDFKYSIYKSTPLHNHHVIIILRVGGRIMNEINKKGLSTSIPLILFSYGARLLPLNILGFLQYLSPTMGFFLAIFYFGESFGTAQLIAFGCIWVALVLFSLSNRIPSARKSN